jgi:hypothetical protein
MAMEKGLKSILERPKDFPRYVFTANVIAHQGVLEDRVQFVQKPFSRTDRPSRIARPWNNNILKAYCS